MKKFGLVFVAVLVFVLALVPLQWAGAEAQQYVYLGGTHLSVDTVSEGLVVMGFAEVQTQSGPMRPAQKAGLAVGDVLLSVDGCTVRTRYDVQQCLMAKDGRTVQLSVRRGGAPLVLTALPAYNPAEGYLLGVYLKDGVQGVGTLTFVHEDGRFAALGHGIDDPDSTNLAATYRGRAYASHITNVIKGVAGTPGELQGTIGEGNAIGAVTANTSLGIYGQADPAMYRNLQQVAVAPRHQVKEGDAVIVCALEDEAPKFYAVRITKCRRQDQPQEKGISLRVTDRRLLERTGGIVQGMSGSPILQDGKLVGAVTHVTVDDPAEGYGVYIDFMM